MSLTRRDVTLFAGVGGLSAMAGSTAHAQGMSFKEEAIKRTVTAFYKAHNRGHWGTLSNLMSEYTTGRSNSQFFPADDPSKETQETASYAHLSGPGFFKNSDEWLSFLKARRERNGWNWDIGARGHFVEVNKENYAVSFVSPHYINGRCWGPGVLCMAFPKFVHVFYCDVDGSDGAISECKITEITEIQLQQVGLRAAERPRQENG